MVQIDLASLFIPLLLRQRFLKHLGKEILPLKTVLRCSWIPPNLAGVKVILPPDSKVLGVIGHIHRKLYQISPLLFRGYGTHLRLIQSSHQHLPYVLHTDLSDLQLSLKACKITCRILQ